MRDGDTSDDATSDDDDFVSESTKDDDTSEDENSIYCSQDASSDEESRTDWTDNESSSKEDGDGGSERPVGKIWLLPSIALLSIVSYAAPPKGRASLLLNGIGSTCREANRTLNVEGMLWDGVLSTSYPGVRAGLPATNRRPPRRSARLKKLRDPPALATGKVRTTHAAVGEASSEALHALNSLAANPGGLTKRKLLEVLESPDCGIRVGGAFLVQVCRAWGVSENVIAGCVALLLERMVENIQEVDQPSTFHDGDTPHTALWVAAVRGLPKVVSLLVEAGSDMHLRWSGTFALRSVEGDYVQFDYATSLEAAVKMMGHEIEGGLTYSEVRDWRQCIEHLS